MHYSFLTKKTLGNKLIKRASKINQKHQMKGKIFDIPSFCSGNCPMKKLQKVQTVDLSNSTNPNRDLLTHY